MFLTDCVFAYFKQNILEGKVEIFCLYPGCPEFIQEEHILKVIENDKDLLKKYKRFERNLRLTRNPNIRWCPRPGCEATVNVNNKLDSLSKEINM